MKIKNPDTGVEEEVFSQAELDVKLKEEGDKIRTEFDGKIKEKEDAITKAATEKSDLEKKLTEMKPDHPNFAALKEALDKKDKDIGDLRTLIEGDKKDRETREMEGFISAVSGKNAELEKKIKFHLENTVAGMKSTTLEERKLKVEAAIKLSVDASEPGLLDTILGGNGGRGYVPRNDEGKVATFTQRERDLGKRLGISDEDYKKYASRVTKKD